MTSAWRVQADDGHPASHRGLSDCSSVVRGLQGEAAAKVYIVFEGAVSRSSAGVEISSLGVGSVFGEAGLLSEVRSMKERTLDDKDPLGCQNYKHKLEVLGGGTCLNVGGKYTPALPGCVGSFSRCTLVRIKE